MNPSNNQENKNKPTKKEEMLSVITGIYDKQRPIYKKVNIAVWIPIVLNYIMTMIIQSEAVKVDNPYIVVAIQGSIYVVSYVFLFNLSRKIKQTGLNGSRIASLYILVSFALNAASIFTPSVGLAMLATGAIASVSLNNNNKVIKLAISKLENGEKLEPEFYATLVSGTYKS